ncbi:MAG: hypothetical protein WKF77_29945 [Planctomycetaceae bacterium]
MSSIEDQFPDGDADAESEDARPSLAKIIQKVKERTISVESSKEHFEQQQPAVSGVFSNMQRLRVHSSASATELREFLSQLKGRSPQEVMGIVAESSLVQGITRATIASAVLLVVFTIIPYAISGGPDSVAPKTPAGNIDRQATSSSTAEPQVPETVAKEAAASPAEPDLKRAAEAMGIGGTAKADADTNPLDTKLDKLLDGIE